jgi:hypothetical protein
VKIARGSDTYMWKVRCKLGMPMKNVESQLLLGKPDEKLGKSYNHPTLRAQIADEDLARWRSPHNRPESKQFQSGRMIKASSFK